MDTLDEEREFDHTPPESLKAGYFDLRCKSCAKIVAWKNPETFSLDIRCPRCSQANKILYDTDQQIYLTDSSGKIIFINEQVELVTGYAREEVMGKTPAIWGAQMPQNFYKELWSNLLHQKKPVVVEMANRRKNGQMFKVRTRIIPILNDKSKVINFLAMQTLLEE